MLSTRLCFIAGFFCLLVPSIHAADDTPTTEETMVVTASRTQESVRDIAGTVHVIQRRELVEQAAPGADLGDVLGRVVPGLGTSTQSRTNFSQTLRGRGIQVLIDGVPQNENRQISRLLDSINIQHIERIEVVSGAGAVYGADGTGGTINIITRDAASEPLHLQTVIGGSMSTESSDDGNLRLAQNISGRLDQVDYMIGISYEKRGNFYDADGVQIAPEPAQTSLNDTEQFDVLAKLGFQLGSQQRLQFSFQTYRDEQDTDYGPNYGGPGVPVLLGQPVENMAIEGLQLEDQPKTERTAFAANYSNGDLLGQVFNARAYYRTRKFRFFPFPLPLQGINPYGILVNHSTSEADVFGAQFTFDSLLNERNLLTWGLDYQNDQGEQYSTTYDPATFVASGGLVYAPEGTEYLYGPDVTNEQTAIFGRLKSTPNDRLNLRLGLRYENIETKIEEDVPFLEAVAFAHGLIPVATPLEGADLSYNELLIDAGVNYEFVENQHLFFSYSEGYELPDMARLLRSALSPNSLLVVSGAFPGGTVVGDAELEAVKVHHFELGWKGIWSRADLHAALFYNESGKTAVFNRDYTVSILDQDKRIYGGELNFGFQFNENLRWHNSFHLYKGDSKDTVSGEWLALSAAEVAPAKWISGLNYRLPDVLEVDLNLLHISDYDDAYNDDAGEAQIEGYTTVALTLGKPFSWGRVQLNVDNLFNEDYQTVYSQWAENIYGGISALPAQGRTVGLNLVLNY